MKNSKTIRKSKENFIEQKRKNWQNAKTVIRSLKNLPISKQDSTIKSDVELAEKLVNSFKRLSQKMTKDFKLKV